MFVIKPLTKNLRIFRHPSGFYAGLRLKSLNIGQTGRPVHAVKQTPRAPRRDKDLSQFETHAGTSYFKMGFLQEIWEYGL